MAFTRCFPALILALFLVSSVNCQSAFTRCRLRYPRETCYAVYTGLRDSLVEYQMNIFELQQAFFPMGRFTSKVLLNVHYTVNTTREDAVPICNGVEYDEDVNTTQDQMNILAGWSKSEIFNIISPLHLSELQLQISNAIYGLFVIPGSGVPLAESFGWKLQNADREQVDLRFVNLIYLNTSLKYVSCMPDEELVMSALQDVTIMLKVWASTNGDIAEAFDDHDLGFPTEPGFRIENVSQIIFTPFFPAMIAAIACILGFGIIIALGVTMPNIYGYLSQERRQFKYYFFALAISLGFLNTLIIIMEVKNIPSRCQGVHFDYVFKQESRGCGGILITKFVYFVFSFIFSFIASLVSSRSSKILDFTSMQIKKCEKLIYMLCCWAIVLFASILVWALPPTILMIIVYPNILLPLTVIMFACVFWLGVILMIPQIFVHNIRMNTHCLDSIIYILPFAGLVLFLFVIGLITVTYINAVVFGSDIGGPIGLLLAIIPPILLTFFSEFYRDWFLTRTSIQTDIQSVIDKDTGVMQESTEMEERPKQQTTNDIDIVFSNSTSVNTSADEPAHKPADKNIVPADTISSIDTLNIRRKHVNFGRRKRSTRLVSTGEPPGFLHRRLQGITARSRVYSTPAFNKLNTRNVVNQV